MVRGHLIAKPLIAIGLLTGIVGVDVVARLLGQQILRSHTWEGTSAGRARTVGA